MLPSIGKLFEIFGVLLVLCVCLCWHPKCSQVFSEWLLHAEMDGIGRHRPMTRDNHKRCFSCGFLMSYIQLYSIINKILVSIQPLVVAVLLAIKYVRSWFVFCFCFFYVYLHKMYVSTVINCLWRPLDIWDTFLLLKHQLLMVLLEHFYWYGFANWMCLTVAYLLARAPAVGMLW